MNNKDALLLNLKKLGLTPDECKVYLSLLDGPKTHLELARKTGVNRTKVYRIAEDLSKRGLIATEQDDLGKRLAASSPANLEIALASAEEKLQNQRQMLDAVLPDLQQMFDNMDGFKPENFVVNTYEGVDGMKQMLWNELKTRNEILVFGHGSIQDLIDDEAWAEKQRSRQVDAGYKVREINNPGGKPDGFSKNKEFLEKVFSRRYIDRKVLPLDQQTVIYNNTVGIYNWKEGKKVGLEIINPAFATTQRTIFEHYWNMAE